MSSLELVFERAAVHKERLDFRLPEQIFGVIKGTLDQRNRRFKPRKTTASASIQATLR